MKLYEIEHLFKSIETKLISGEFTLIGVSLNATCITSFIAKIGEIEIEFSKCQCHYNAKLLGKTLILTDSTCKVNDNVWQKLIKYN